MTLAYYNEIDPFKAQVLREAIKAGAITPGDVDERSIADVEPGGLVGYAQCHFFAGGGFWSLALRQAGWPDDREVWTGSCPCPSFSAAGKGEGFADARHLWPEWYRLIRQRRPASILGEQVAAAIGHGWLDLVCGDMETEGYAIAAAVLGAHSAGAPHIRQRLYFVGVGPDAANRHRGSREWAAETRTGQDRQWRRGFAGSGSSSQLTHADGGESCDGDIQRSGQHGLFAPDRGTGVGPDAERDGGRADLAQRGAQGGTTDGRDRATGDGSHTAKRGQPMRRSAPGSAGHTPCAGESERGAHPLCDGSEEWIPEPASRQEGHPDGIEYGSLRSHRGTGWLDPQQARSVAEEGATSGFWADCDWWYGRDGKYRPIGPGLQPLAHGSPVRVGRLRMYGDAICVPAAQAFIEAYMDCTHVQAENRGDRA